ncbi:N-acetyl-gamma-glutamyl-phosphate reductase [Botrimarina mediterranea]|uniref:N-acetyl-gamma-glutamyl-phosphate reductase n=1 Tax=Botrimarina mediterranea TaxID=2528022 RepID=A0A518K6B6_9BACT|nr:N-acetyl-gamma-glutamyl-phosphate reductase [Botrimarina mediterranea]QDV73336.1 N-acetyl-gamma-glutamyl-phosphate reductase [Botrimarina mediterranea]QDV77853.1 N-acetyl-gamma-glutamyl-phosphate reductase [Planctomycetes bacterium K2D]
MARVAIYGASGYTGLELLKLLARHPHAQVTALLTRQDEAPHLSEIHPQLTGSFDLRLENLSVDQVAERADVAFTCLPHAASAEVCADLLSRGVKVVDLSADYRLGDAGTYQQWYGHEHPDAARLGKTPYGLPELFREQIIGADLIANPGCYPTSAILALTPLLRAGLIEREGIVVDSKSGVSGAGRTPKLLTHYPECNESFSAYGVGTHRHMPEIDRVLSMASDQSKASHKAIEVLFTPHLVPMDRGILSTIYATPKGDATPASVMAALKEAYANEPFVSAVEAPPATKHVAHTNRCHVYGTVVRGKVLLVSVIDNLIKGASGAAVQNFNLMCGFDETTALR